MHLFSFQKFINQISIFTDIFVIILFNYIVSNANLKITKKF